NRQYAHGPSRRLHVDGHNIVVAPGDQRGGDPDRSAAARGGRGMTADAPRENRPPAGGSTSRSLLAEAKLADPAAWERLAKLYAPLVAFWCRRWGVADQDIVDVLQEVFSAVASHLDRFRKERAADTFRGWLLTLARCTTRGHIRPRR